MVVSNVGKIRGIGHAAKGGGAGDRQTINSTLSGPGSRCCTPIWPGIHPTTRSRVTVRGNGRTTHMRGLPSCISGNHPRHFDPLRMALSDPLEMPPAWT